MSVGPSGRPLEGVGVARGAAHRFESITVSLTWVGSDQS